MPSSFEYAAACVGLASMYRIVAPKWLRVDRKPLNCWACLSFWGGLLVAYMSGNWLVPPIAYMMAICLSGFAPWGFPND